MDGDALAYRVAAANEKEHEWAPGEITLSTSLPAAFNGIDIMLRTWMEHHKASGLRVAMSDTPWTFRMGVFKGYKAHRADKRKPLGLQRIRQHLYDKHGASDQPGLEADDLMGLWMTDRYADTGIIVSWDKDMRAVPGRFWVPGTEAVEVRDELEANLMWMAQTLSGDQADGYPGCKNVGLVRAKRIAEDALEAAIEKYGETSDHELAAEMHLRSMWERVLAEFLKKGHTEKEALVSARLARILRHGDYNLTSKEVRLWTPGEARSSWPSIPMRREPVKARARKSSNTSRGKQDTRWTSSASPTRSVVRRAKCSLQGGPKRRSAST